MTAVSGLHYPSMALDIAASAVNFATGCAHEGLGVLVVTTEHS